MEVRTTSTLNEPANDRVKEGNKVGRYTYQDTLEKCMAYFEGDELAATTWMNKYALKNPDGSFAEATPDDMHRRMAKEFAKVETQYREAASLNGSFKRLSAYGQQRAPLTAESIYQLFKDFKYVIPQGSVMSGLGNNNVLASLSNCVVMPEILDSYGGIMYTDQQLAQLFKRRCGVGIDISGLRPANMLVSNAAGSTSGATSFMERYSNTTREVAQNGRRGALMITMDIAHPDVVEFITMKQQLSKVTGANVSVRLSDEFMEAVSKDQTYVHRWPIYAQSPQCTKTVRAKEVWDTIIKCAHNTAEPGLIFWDRQHRYSTSSVYPDFENVSTNPCSEIAMQGGDSCRLIAINLYSFVVRPFHTDAYFDYGHFYQTVYESQRLMDDLVDLEIEAIDNIIKKIDRDQCPDHIKFVERSTWELLRENGLKGRRTGLGFTALADTLAALGLKFDEDEAIAATERIMKEKCRAEFDSTIDMAIERGKFEAFDPSTEQTSDFVKMLANTMPDVYDRMMAHGRRNISISTVAPTGTLSLLAQTSSGIEPVFMLAYKRRRKVSSDDENAHVGFVDHMGDRYEEFMVYHPKIKDWMGATAQTDYTKSPYFGATAPEINWQKRIELQAIVQRYVTHSISSTINLPHDTPLATVAEIYMTAWKMGLKGITVYRDGSRDGVLVAHESKPKAQEKFRPEKINAEVVHFRHQTEQWVAIIGLLDNTPHELYTIKLGDALDLPKELKNGWVCMRTTDEGEHTFDFEYIIENHPEPAKIEIPTQHKDVYNNYSTLLSALLRQGMPVHEVVGVLEGLHISPEAINTWQNGVARALRQYIPDGTQAPNATCPSCGDPQGLVYEEGCVKCKSCGISKCS